MSNHKMVDDKTPFGVGRAISNWNEENLFMIEIITSAIIGRNESAREFINIQFEYHRSATLQSVVFGFHFIDCRHEC
jgi:hypothetical protein